MKAYLAHTENALRLLSRNKTALFFTYLFPLFFFFMFAGIMGGAKNPGDMLRVISVVLTLGVLGSGLLGAGITMVQEREENILRRFKVTPSGALPILLAVLTSGLVAYLPLVAVIFGLTRGWLHVPLPPRFLEVTIFSAVGLVAFRGIGVLIACVVRSTQESSAIVNLVYLPMLMLSGAMLPLQFLPPALQTATVFLPSYYLFTGMQSMLLTGEGLWHNALETVALLVTAGVTTFLALRLFRWDRDDVIPGRAKWWIIAGLTPFFAVGLTKLNRQARIEEGRMQARAEHRNVHFVVDNVRIFVGNGRVIEHGRVLVRHGEIVEVSEETGGAMPPEAEVINGAGKTLLPGLIDMHVHLGASGLADGGGNEKDPEATRLMDYLYCGVTAVRSVGDMLDRSLAVKAKVESGRVLGAELFVYGPMFTAEGGHGTEYLSYVPDTMRPKMREEMLRIPKDPAEAKRMVDGLKRDGADGVKAILQGDFGHVHFARLERPNYEAVARAAHADHLPLATHTNTVQDVEDAIAVGSDTIEHGALTGLLPPADLAAMRDKNLAYDPTLSVVGVLRDAATGKASTPASPLLQEILPADKLRKLGETGLNRQTFPQGEEYFNNAAANLLAAWRAGVPLIAGSDAGNPSIIHGPTVQRELALWVEAGIPAPVALQAATYQAAKALRADGRIGLVAKDQQATFLLVDGDPTVDIHALERIATVVYRGEIVERAALLKAAKEP